jgi:DNA-binding transcriptional ArsR family regulator
MNNQKPERFNAQHEIRKKNRLEIMATIDKFKDKGISFNEICRTVHISRPQIYRHIRKLLDERLVEKQKGFTLVKKKDREYKYETELYFLTDKGMNALKGIWWIQKELERMINIIEADKLLPDSERNLVLSEYSGHSQSSGWGIMYYPYRIMIHSKKLSDRNLEFLINLKEAFFDNMQRHILEKICSNAIEDGMIPIDFTNNDNDKIIWAGMSKKICDAYLLDDNAELFIGFHIKIKDFRTWLSSDFGIDRLRAVLTDTPFPIDDWIGVNIDELKPLFKITNKSMLEKMDLKGLDIPKLSLLELMRWFQSDPSGQKYFSEFAPITYSDALFQWMKKTYEKLHPGEDKLIAWMDTKQGKEYEREGLVKFEKEQNEVNSHSIVQIGWVEMFKWLMSMDGQIYLKALSEIAPFPHQFHMFLKRGKSRWTTKSTKRVEAAHIKIKYKDGKPALEK